MLKIKVKDVVESISNGVIPAELAEIRTYRNFVNSLELMELQDLERVLWPLAKRDFEAMELDMERFGSLQSDYLASTLYHVVSAVLADEISIFYYGCPGYV